MLFISPAHDNSVTWFGFAMLLVSLLCFYFIDYAFLKISLDEEKISVTGFFNIRKVVWKRGEIRGFRVKERFDNHNGIHEAYQLINKSDGIIFFPKIAYSNYQAIKILFEENYDYLGKIELKNANFYARWMPIIAFVSGILALLVALKKFF